MTTSTGILSPTPQAMETVPCGSCGATAGRVIGTFRHLYRIRRCAVCGLTYTSSRPTAEVTNKHFEDDYIVSSTALNDDFGHRRRRAMERVFTAVSTRHPGGGTILDVGAAGGELLSMFPDPDWDKVALEPAAVGAAQLAANGLEVVEDFYPSSQLLERTFDVIAMMDVIMLMPDPLSALVEARRQLRPGGTLAVEIPGHAYRTALHVGPVPLLRRKGWTDLNASIHLFFFSDRTLRAMLDRAGLRVVEVVTLPPSPRQGVLGHVQRVAGDVVERLPGIRSGAPSLAAKYLYLAEPVTA